MGGGSSCQAFKFSRGRKSRRSRSKQGRRCSPRCGGRDIPSPQPAAARAERNAPRRSESARKLKFTFKEQREFESIDDDIAKLEEKIETLDAQIAANATNSVKLRELMEKKEETENALDEKMDRWVYLNDLNEKIQDAKQQG